MGTKNATGYSASVRIWLRRGNDMIPLSHSAATFVIARQPTNLPAGDADIVFTVDDARYERPVTLVNGMTTENREAMVLARDGVSPF